MRTLPKVNLRGAEAQSNAPEDPEAAVDVTFTIVEARMRECHGWMGYMDMYTTADWTDHRGRVSRLARTDTVWGVTTEASWDHSCPTKTWFENAGRDAPSASEPPCSVTFTVWMESLGGFGLPEPLGNVVSVLHDFVDTCDDSTRGSKHVEYSLTHSGSSVGNFVVMCEFAPSLSRAGRTTTLRGTVMFPAPASNTSGVEEASESSIDIDDDTDQKVDGIMTSVYKMRTTQQGLGLRGELGLGQAAGQAGLDVPDRSPRDTAMASPRSARKSRRG